MKHQVVISCESYEEAKIIKKKCQKLFGKFVSIQEGDISDFNKALIEALDQSKD